MKSKGEKTRVLLLNLTGDHRIIDDFTWKESWKSSDVASTFLDEEPQIEIGFIQDDTYLVVELGGPCPYSLSTILHCHQEGRLEL